VILRSFQRRLILLPASHRSHESRDVGKIRLEFAKSRGSRSEHRARHVSARSNHHVGYSCGNSSNWCRILIGGQKTGSSLQLCVSRSDRQLCHFHDILSGLSVGYIRGIAITDGFRRFSIRVIYLS